MLCVTKICNFIVNYKFFAPFFSLFTIFSLFLRGPTGAPKPLCCPHFLYKFANMPFFLYVCTTI